MRKLTSYKTKAQTYNVSMQQNSLYDRSIGRGTVIIKLMNKFEYLATYCFTGQERRLIQIIQLY